MLQRENKSLTSAILDLGEQMQKMDQMLQDFCNNYAPINNPQSEVETKIDEMLTGVRNTSNMGSAEKLKSSALAPGTQPASRLPQAYPHHLASLPSTPITPPPHTAVPPPLLSPPIPLLHHPPILQGLKRN